MCHWLLRGKCTSTKHMISGDKSKPPRESKLLLLLYTKLTRRQLGRDRHRALPCKLQIHQPVPPRARLFQHHPTHLYRPLGHHRPVSQDWPQRRHRSQRHRPSRRPHQRRHRARRIDFGKAQLRVEQYCGNQFPYRCVVKSRWRTRV